MTQSLISAHNKFFIIPSQTVPPMFKFAHFSVFSLWLLTASFHSQCKLSLIHCIALVSSDQFVVTLVTLTSELRRLQLDPDDIGAVSECCDSDRVVIRDRGGLAHCDHDDGGELDQ